MENKASESNQNKIRKNRIRKLFQEQRRVPPTYLTHESQESIQFDQNCLDFLGSIYPCLVLINQPSEESLNALASVLENYALQQLLTDAYLLHYIQKYVLHHYDSSDTNALLLQPLTLKLIISGVLNTDDEFKLCALNILQYLSGTQNLVVNMCDEQSLKAIQALSEYVFSENTDISGCSLWIICNLTPEFQNYINWKAIIPYIRSKIKNATVLHRFISVSVWVLSKYMKHLVHHEQEAKAIMLELRRYLSIETQAVKQDAFNALDQFVKRFNPPGFLSKHGFIPHLEQGLQNRQIMKQALQVMENMIYTSTDAQSSISLDIKISLFNIYEKPLKHSVRSVLLRVLSNILVQDHQNLDQKFLVYLCHLVSTFPEIQYPIEVITEQFRLLGNIAMKLSQEIVLNIFNEKIFEFVIDQTKHALYLGKAPLIQRFGTFIIHQVLKAENAISEQKYYYEFAIMKNIEYILQMMSEDSQAHTFVKSMMETFFSLGIEPTIPEENEDLIDL